MCYDIHHYIISLAVVFDLSLFGQPRSVPALFPISKGKALGTRLKFGKSDQSSRIFVYSFAVYLVFF